MQRLIRFAAIGLIGTATLSVHAAAPNHPNVLWICADDHAPYVIGAYGNAKVHTPNLDRLAASGMRFDRAYCNSPVCTASRQSFITGRYPRTLGVTQLKTALSEHETTLADVLKQAGYETAAIGKMHFNSPLKHGFDLRLDLEDHRRALAAHPAVALPHGVPVLPVWRPFKDPARIWLNSFVRPYGARDADMDGSYFAKQAAAFLKQTHEKPFFLVVSFYEPHSPFRFPIEDRKRHDPVSFRVPEVGPEDEPQIPAVFRDLTSTEKQGITAAYYTSVEFLDRNVGRVLDALDQSEQSGKTLVIYTGDHGYFLGQHGRFEKHSSYEEAIRAPLLIREPGVSRAGTSSKALVELIDIVPTVLESCRVPVPARVQGRSLVPLLNGTVAKHRAVVYVEYAPNEEATVRDDRWKLIYKRGKRRRTDGYDPGWSLSGRSIQLFDLDTDPSEMHNLAAAPENTDRVQHMLELLADHLKSTAREPERIPKTDNLFELLDFCVQSRDVDRPASRSNEPRVDRRRVRQ